MHPFRRRKSAFKWSEVDAAVFRRAGIGRIDQVSDCVKMRSGDNFGDDFSRLN